MRGSIALVCLVVSSLACGPPTVRSTSYADPEIACPGGKSAWNLDIVDQRVDPEGSEKALAAIRDGIQKSFPGCAWKSAPGAGADAIVIEIHRFASHLEYDREGTGSWEAAAEWTVRAVNAEGRTLTEFQANEEVSRPNYKRSNNEKESLSEAYEKALERTVRGLRSVPAIGAFRPRAGTAETALERGGTGSAASSR